MLITILVMVEGLGVPVPGELALVVGGAFAEQGDLSLIGVVLASWIGTILGGTGGYWIGRTGGVSLVSRYGHRIGITDKKLQDARRYFTDHGAKTVIIARFIAILRILSGIIAGVAHMPFGLFTLCNAVGGLGWSVAFALLGDFFGSEWPRLAHYLHRIGLVTVGIIVVAIVGAIIWRRRRHQSTSDA